MANEKYFIQDLQVRNAQSASGRNGHVSCVPGTGANGQRTGCYQRNSAYLFLRLLRVRAVCLRTQWLLWSGLFLWRNLSWRRTMGKLGL